jgi:hypothetical protein
VRAKRAPRKPPPPVIKRFIANVPLRKKLA